MMVAQDPAPMVDPSIDNQPGPFSYFSKSVDEIGVMDAQQATEITPEASLYTGFGELVFLVGPQMQPVSPRIRTLEKGYLPIVHTSWNQDGIEYRFTFFAARLKDNSIVNFARVVEKNLNPVPTRSVFTVGSRYQNDSANGSGTGENRFARPTEGKRAGDYRQPGVEFDPNWVYSFSDHGFLRSGKVFYLTSDTPDEKMLTPKQFYNIQIDNTPRSLPIFPTTLVGLMQYNRILAPGEERTLTFRMPLVPVEDGPAAQAVLAADYEAALADTVRGWEQILSTGMQIDLPESKVSDTFRASLVFDLLARDHIGDDIVQTVNKLHYHAFWLRDAADIAHMYDVTGYPKYASDTLAFFPRFQNKDGLFLSQEGQFDAQGEVLWEYGEHYRLTHDLAFAKSVFPSVERAVDWLMKARRDDPLHLIPASYVKDNEYVSGHITGYNLLALDGLESAALIAEAVGQPEKARAYRNEYELYRKDLLNAIERCANGNGGAIPPHLDGDCKGGNDWGNLLGTYPGHVLPPQDPLITVTLKMVQAKYQEGLTTYGMGRYVHHYLIFKNMLTEIARGEQQQVLKDLYAVLTHTSSTQEGFEFAIRSWGDRDFSDNLTPHGWFAAEYRSTLRAMMVRDDGRDVHLLSVMSPAWMGAGKTIKVEDAPTEFGVTGFTLTQPDDNTAQIRLDSNWREKPDSLLLHLPWFADVRHVEADGRRLTPSDGIVKIPVDAREVTLHWQRRSDAPDMSYEAAVQQFRKEYQEHFNQYMHGQ
ncbi:MAG: hypothetical protein FWD64_00650 [Acidobacteriaceae bacterium]|nr:hypothetical protein [Acidobacteriaceae bacterium]